VGKIFADRYEIIELLGQGAMGIVYKARHKFMNRVVAIKILHPFLLSDLNNVKRFRQEAEAASALQHPNVIQIHDFGLTSSGEAFLVMEFLEGTGLDELLAKGGPIPVERSLEIFLQCCDALEHAHKHSIIHRDLKPSNIVLVKDQSGRDQVKIVDFGIAKFTSKEKSDAPSLTQEGSIHGSPMYMSPEQCQAHPMDARSDIYSFGCLMYETLIGSPPFKAEHSIDAMYMHCRTAPPSLLRADSVHTIPARLDQIILKALSKEPAKRQQTIAELRDELMPLKSAQSAVN
jgi:serine/threonine-protein kinase